MPDCANQTLLLALEALPHPLLVLDSHGVIQSTNETARTLTGVTTEDAGQLPFWELVHPDDLARVRRALLDRSTGTQPITLECRLSHPSSQATTMRWTVHRIAPTSGDIPLMVLSPDHRQQAERRREFLSHAGHELRNPLSSILAFAETLHEGIHGSLNEAQMASMQAIRDNVQRQLDLINQFIEREQLEAGAVPVTLGACQLTDVVQGALANVLDLTKGRSMQMHTSIRPADAVVSADSKRLTQIIAEVLAIGTISCPVGGELRLDLAADNAAESLEICLEGGPSPLGFAISRNSKAMDQASLKSLARVRKLRPIGLALLENLVKNYHGTLRYQASESGSMGMLISLVLTSTVPEAPAPVAALRPPTTPLVRSAPVASTTAEPPLVLLVDDQLALSTITRDYLESIGLRVDVAFDGQEAITKALSLHPDLIMMDVQMPVMDGLEATRRLRLHSDPRIAKVPIISLSGLAVAGDMEKCLAAGATAYLAKPFGVQQLHRAISEFIALP